MRRIRQAVEVKSATSDESVDLRPFEERFVEAMDDDLSTPQAVAAIFDLVREVFKGRDAGNDVSGAIESIRDLTGVLGFTLEAPPEKAGLSDEEVQALVDQRIAARTEKRWADADALRAQLGAADISISDTGMESAWSRD
jgi:cysteinyl-tRNA synthetase